MYFNEIDKYCAKWLGSLYPAATIDARDIREVNANSLGEYRRCHFFAGIAGWEYALQLADWPAEREVWTGSCPCQPFSNAGKRKGTADKRHLWPDFLRLIAERRPTTIFGEQVASKLGREWLARVRTDLEALGYAVGAADLPAASVGAPHRRYRLFWVADGNGTGRQIAEGCSGHAKQGRRPVAESIDPNGLGPTDGQGLQPGCQASTPSRPWNSFITTSCHDGRTRRLPIEPSFHPLAHGIPARVVRSRGYGNAIVPQVAAVFIRSFLEAA